MPSCRDLAARFAGALAARGVGRGDRVVLYLPMIPEAAVAMLGCARIGAVHSVVFGGFAANELATRIDDAKPKLIVSGSCGIEVNRVIAYKPLLDEAIERASHKPAHCIVVQRPELEASLTAGRDETWAEVMAAAEPVDCVPVAATDPLYILYTSGTTGDPKGIVRDNGGHLVALHWTMHGVYGRSPGQVWWAASDIGWVVGHSYIVYAPLIYGCPSILYEGKPGRHARCRRLLAGDLAARGERHVHRAHGIPRDQARRSRMRPSSRTTTSPASTRSSSPASGPIPTPSPGPSRACSARSTTTGGRPSPAGPWAPTARASARCRSSPARPPRPVPGYRIEVVDEAGEQVPAGSIGSIVVKQPLPPGFTPTLWNNDKRFEEAYFTRFPGYYLTGDAGVLDEDGYLWIMSRTDDIINVAGHRLSTGAMEEVLAAHQDVAECAVVGVADTLKGQLPLGFVVLKAGVNRPPDEIVVELVRMVRESIGPVAAFKQAVVVDRLPKTRSGKILRGTIAKIADGEAYKTPGHHRRPGDPGRDRRCRPPARLRRRGPKAKLRTAAGERNVNGGPAVAGGCPAA